MNKNACLIKAGDLNARTGKTPARNVVGNEVGHTVNKHGHPLIEFRAEKEKMFLSD